MSAPTTFTFDEGFGPLQEPRKISEIGPSLYVNFGSTCGPSRIASTRVDGFNGKVQFLVYDPPGPESEETVRMNDDGNGVDPAVAVRLNDDGSVAEISIRRDLMDKVKPDTAPSPWIEARDKGVADET